jgi:hypothetical protein
VARVTTGGNNGWRKNGDVARIVARRGVAV